MLLSHGRWRPKSLATHPHSQPSPRPHLQIRHCQGDRHTLNEASLEAQGVNRCTEGCVLWSQHLRRWEGWWAEKEGLSGPDGSEEGKWGEVVRKQETRKPRMTRKGAKSKKFRKDERGKRKKQNRAWAKKKTRRQSRRRDGNGKGRRWRGKDVRRERRNQEENIPS